jgi:tetratricopeptide (TPR) repeat protein
MGGVRRRGSAELLTLVAASLLLAGCGDPALWARYRAERELWVAYRDVARLRIDPASASEHEFERAAAKFRRVTTDSPVARWTLPGRGPIARDVAALSGRAGIGEAQVEELRGRDARALELYTRVGAEYHALPEVALDAAVGRAQLLDRTGPVLAAERAWRDVIEDFAPVDERSGQPRVAVLDAPLLVAQGLVARGEPAAADSVLRDAASRWELALRALSGRAAAPELLLHLSDARARSGDVAGSLAALRAALQEPAAAAARPRIVLALAERSLAGPGPDSALAYAAWAEHGFDGIVRPEARMIAARAWEASGVPDSALEAYERLVDDRSTPPGMALHARLLRARELERTGRWDQARSEYRTLASLQPTDPLALEALLDVVEHHLRRGEHDQAESEGRRALDALDRLLERERDGDVQWRVRHARVRLLHALGDTEGAAAALAETWERFPDGSVDDTLGLATARAVATLPSRRALAMNLYRQLASRALRADTRRTARDVLERMRRATPSEPS